MTMPLLATFVALRAWWILLAITFFWLTTSSTSSTSSASTPTTSPFATSYIYQSSNSSAWVFVGCYDRDFAIASIHDLYYLNERGSLYDCTLWASLMNFSVIGMFNNGQCWGWRAPNLDVTIDVSSPDYITRTNELKIEGTLVIDGTTATSSPAFDGAIELGSGESNSWMPCVYRRLDFIGVMGKNDSTETGTKNNGLENISKARGDDNISNGDNLTPTSIGIFSTFLYNSPLEKMQAAIYSDKARHEIFDIFFSSFVSEDICDLLFSKELVNTPRNHPFCPKISEVNPDFFRDARLKNRIPIFDFYLYEEGQNSSYMLDWGEASLELYHRSNYCFGYTKRSKDCPYCSDNCVFLFDKYNESLKNKVAVVLGSQTPWLESSILNAGASHVFTVEYLPILTRLSSLTVMHPKQLASVMRAGMWSQVDIAFSFSSIEHSGLGRYGDNLQVHADFIAIGQIRCLLKPGGLLFLTVPVGTDLFVFNAHRIYGRHRLPLLLKGWDVVDVIGEFDLDQEADATDSYMEPVIVLRKPIS